jgi:hypothetical protein
MHQAGKMDTGLQTKEYCLKPDRLSRFLARFALNKLNSGLCGTCMCMQQSRVYKPLGTNKWNQEANLDVYKQGTM